MVNRQQALPPIAKGRRFRSELPWVSLVLAGSLAPLLFVLATGHTLAWRDTSRLFAPMRSLIADALREGRLPLWNPYEALGMPLFAQLLHGVLHPWSLLAAFVARNDGIDLLIVLHVATGAIGAGVLARTLGASRTGSAIAGLGYGLSGYLLGMSAVIQYLAAGSSAPWAITGLLTASRGGARNLVLGALGIAVLHFAGDPQWALIAAMAGALLAWDSQGRRGLVRVAAAVAAGSALAAIQLIPSWALLHASSRSGGLSPQDRLQWAFSPFRTMEFMLPGLFAGRPGTASDPVYSWVGGGMYPLPFLPSVFLGLPVLLLAGYGIRINRTTRLLGWSALLFLWLSFGHFAGAAYTFGWVPVWNSFRYAEKLVGPLTLCVAVLAALGLERFLDRLRARSTRFLFLAAAAAALAAALSASLAAYAPPPWFIPGEAWTALGRRCAAGLALASVGASLFGLEAYRRNRSRAEDASSAAPWIVAAVLATGLAGSLAALHAGSRDSRAGQPLAELHAAAPVVRIVNPLNEIVLPDSVAMDDFDALQAVQSRSGIAPYAVPSRIDNFTTYTGLLPNRFDALAGALNGLGDAKWTAFRRFAVTHVVLTRPATPADELAAEAAVRDGRLVETDPAWNLSVWEVPHRPWARFAKQVLPVNEESEAVAAVAERERSGDGTTVLQGKRPSMLSPGTVLSFERRPDHVRIEAETKNDGLLVVADAYWDGWKAFLDGRPADIEIADGLMRAVRWPAGRHVLDMRYRPAEVRLGTVVSGVAAFLLLGLLLREQRQRRQELSSPPTPGAFPQRRART
jgi:hypothetical protein